MPLADNTHLHATARERRAVILNVWREIAAVLVKLELVIKRSTTKNTLDEAKISLNDGPEFELTTDSIFIPNYKCDF